MPTDWQVECLNSKQFLEDRSIIVSLPTSAGKVTNCFPPLFFAFENISIYVDTTFLPPKQTFIAEIALMRCVYLKNKTALFILPFVSIVTEKAESMNEFASILNFRVEVSYEHQRGVVLAVH